MTHEQWKAFYIGMVIGGLLLLVIAIINGCGEARSRALGQTGVLPVVCTHNGVVTLQTTVNSTSMRFGARTTSPPRCGTWTGVFAQAKKIEPVPFTTVPEVVCFKDTTGQLYLVDPRDCTGLDWIGALPTPGCPPGMHCYRGEEPPCP